ncbi:bacterial regulatory, tetR family protein [Rhodococcus sp. MTM3W5.2]|uniref:TetR/AcrR family transcriptional regulator n=1 Tax=Rhodococcus sp. MTM3W5.2 TaxID=1805827 RepID=UPI000979752E|nr:TetR/AcrR family transcriptional regulator [Rhodococcus sp. MTM3W5.2]AQA20941.1 bacterial regulatory, tetR family protein [Rhodococcus sp. MTM3W5.2]
MKHENPPRAGRPRDLSKDEATLVATRRLLAEVGYQQTTVAAIARMAGVNTPAIYRRWPTREALIEEAVHGTGGHPLPEESGDLRTDLATWVRIFLVRAARPAARAGVPGLLADSQTQEARQRLLAIGAPVRKAFQDLLDGAVARGEIAAGVNAMFLFDLLSGTTTMRGLTREWRTRRTSSTRSQAPCTCWPRTRPRRRTSSRCADEGRRAVGRQARGRGRAGA